MKRLLPLFALLLATMRMQAQTPKPLFADEAPLSLTLTARMTPIVRDRVKPKADSLATKHPARLTYLAGTDTVQMPVKLSVRGNFRRDAANCKFPPLYLDVPKKAAKKTVFASQDKMKLVTHCQSEEYVVREYLIYRIYNLLTDLSFRARLARVTYADSLAKRPTETRWGILLEDIDDLAKRNRVRTTKIRTKAQFADSLTMATIGVFEYMIGNTDWSVPFQHNIRVLIDSTKKRPLLVPYDFDHSGLVNARYAKPAEQLNISTVRDRLYRGPGYPMPLLKQAIDRFVAIKPAVYALYEKNPHLDRDYIKDTLRYLDEFYETIANPKYVQRLFATEDTSGVQIRGLK